MGEPVLSSSPTPGRGLGPCGKRAIPVEVRAPPADRVAVIDLGSGTATLALYRRDGAGFDLEPAAEVTRDLGLMRLVDGRGTLGPDALAMTVAAVREFTKLARAFEADRIEAIATSAVRDLANRDVLVQAIRDATGVEVRVISGEEEARLAVAAVGDLLPPGDAVVADLGGGSLQVARVRRQRPLFVATLPLGSVRTHLGFLPSDPPTGPEVVALRRHVEATLRAVPWVGDGGVPLVGVGGTVRALAKIVRRAQGLSGDLHGFLLTADDVLDAVDLLSRIPECRRAEVPGLKSRRAGSIVAGAVVTAALLRATGTDALVVSARGIREGCLQAL